MPRHEYSAADIAKDTLRIEKCNKAAVDFANTLHRLAEEHPSAFAGAIGHLEHIEVGIGSNGKISGWSLPGHVFGHHDDNLAQFISNKAAERAATCRAANSR